MHLQIYPEFAFGAEESRQCAPSSPVESFLPNSPDYL